MCALSPVFNAMFSGDFVEGQSSRVTIKEMEDGTLELLLKAMYGMNIGEVDDSVAAEILQAAMMYQVDVVVKSIVNRMVHGITTDNVLRMAILAGRHQQAMLYEECVSYAAMSNGVLDAIMQDTSVISADVASGMQFINDVRGLTKCKRVRVDTDLWVDK